MSLIEEALRKQEQEAGKQRQPFVSSLPAGISTSVAPATPVRQPSNRPAVSSPAIARPGLHPDFGQPRNFARIMFAGVGLLALLLAAGVFFLLPEKAKKTAVSTAPAPATKPSIPPPVAAKPPPSVAAVAPVVAPATSVLSRPVADSGPRAPTASATVAGMAPLVSNATVAVVTPAGSPAGDSAPVAPPPPPAVIWPELVIKGMFSAGGKTLVPLGDGLTLETGTTAPNGVRLLEATPALIRVSFRGQTRIYRRKGGSYMACTNEISGL